MYNKFRPADYTSRLDRCIFLYDGAPYQLVVDSTESFVLHKIGGDRRAVKKIKPNDPKLDISTVPHGFFQNGPHAHYVKRNPTRMYKQGIFPGGRGSNIVVSALTVKGFVNIASETVLTDGFSDSILGKFPSYDQAVQKLTKEGHESIALTRDIALLRRKDAFIVFYTTDEVGWITPGTRTVKVPSSDDAWVISKYLSELNWVVE